MHRPMLPVAAALTLALSACGSDDETLREDLQAAVGDGYIGPADTSGEFRGGKTIPDAPVDVPGEVIDAEGSVVGVLWFRDADVGTEIEVEVSGLSPGFHPMYLFDAAVCDTESRSSNGPVGPFLSAGDLIQELPSLLVLANGVGSTTTLVAGDPEQLLEGDGTAVIIADPIVEEPPAIDVVGSRVACGAIGGEEV